MDGCVDLSFAWVHGFSGLTQETWPHKEAILKLPPTDNYSLDVRTSSSPIFVKSFQYLATQSKRLDVSCG